MSAPDDASGAPTSHALASSGGRRFTLHECLGRGGFGEVFRATVENDLGVTTAVAVKLLHLDVLQDRRAVRRLHDEARLLAALDHPAILRIYDLVMLGDRLALVTEYVDGQDLLELMTCKPRMPVRAIVGALGEVASALHTAFTGTSPVDGSALRLVHRDIKPGNIRVGRHGQVKLLDFGLAHMEEAEDDSVTEPYGLTGTLPYLAPECFSGTRSSEADVFALAATMFGCIHGERLFNQDDRDELTYTLMAPSLYEPFVHERLEQLPRTIPWPLFELLRQSLSFDPEERPSAMAFARRCEAAADEMQGVSLGTWARGHDWAPRPSMTSELTGTTVQGTDVELPEATPAPAARAHAPPHTSRARYAAAAAVPSLIVGPLGVAVGVALTLLVLWLMR